MLSNQGGVTAVLGSAIENHFSILQDLFCYRGCWEVKKTRTQTKKTNIRTGLSDAEHEEVYNPDRPTKRLKE